MKRRSSLSGLAVAPLLAAAIAAPSAAAQPIDAHASAVQKPAAAQLDFRSENTRDPRSLAPVIARPVAHDGGDGVEGVDWPVAILVAGGTLLVGGTLIAAGTRHRVVRSHAAS